MNFYKNFLHRAPDTYIEIVSGDINTHKLKLSPNEDNDGYRKKKVIWAIGPKATKVKSFRIEMISGTDIFENTSKPPASHVTKGFGTIKHNAVVGSVYNYGIHWKDKEDKDHFHDPKISIKPDLHSEHLIKQFKVKWIIVTIILLVLIFLLWKYYVNAS